MWTATEFVHTSKGDVDRNVIESTVTREVAVRIVTEAADAHVSANGHAIAKRWDYPGKVSIHCECHDTFMATSDGKG